VIFPKAEASITPTALYVCGPRSVDLKSMKAEEFPVGVSGYATVAGEEIGMGWFQIRIPMSFLCWKKKVSRSILIRMAC
jgi:hypothetical protein